MLTAARAPTSASGRAPPGAATTGSLSAGWARSSWSCGHLRGAVGGVIDPLRSSWSRSSWSSAGEDASTEAAEYAAAVEAAQDTGTLDAPIPADAVIPDDAAPRGQPGSGRDAHADARTQRHHR